MRRFRLLFALLAISLFFNAYLLARSQDAARQAEVSPRAVLPVLDLTPDQALGLESVRRFAEIRWQRRAERQAVPMAVLRQALSDLDTPAADIATAIEDLGTIDAQYRMRVMGELSKWSESLQPAQRARLDSELARSGIASLVPRWE